MTVHDAPAAQAIGEILDRTSLPPALALRGWFQAGWTTDFPDDMAVPLKYFGRELVGYRDAAGEVLIFDAFCPHLGAHLGYGGRVEPDGIVCPFHGWKWNSAGENVDIPYRAKVTRNRAKRLIKWHTIEENGIVFLWHDPHGAPPAWPAPSVADGVFLDHPMDPVGAHAWDDVRVHPQLALENAADAAHFKWVHGSSSVARCTGYAPSGPEFNLRYQLRMGRPDRRTWAADEGGKVATLVTRAVGAGLLLARFAQIDDAVNMLNITPVDADTSRLMSTVWIPGAERDDLSAGARARIAEQEHQIGRDLVIWEHMAYVDRPPYPPEESRPFVALRDWSRQFYRTSSGS